VSNCKVEEALLVHSSVAGPIGSLLLSHRAHPLPRRWLVLGSTGMYMPPGRSRTAGTLDSWYLAPRARLSLPTAFPACDELSLNKSWEIGWTLAISYCTCYRVSVISCEIEFCDMCQGFLCKHFTEGYLQLQMRGCMIHGVG